MSGEKIINNNEWDWSEGLLSKSSSKLFQSSPDIRQATKELEIVMGNLTGSLRHSTDDSFAGYSEHSWSTEWFDEFLQEVEGNVAKLIKIINGEEL